MQMLDVLRQLAGTRIPTELVGGRAKSLDQPAVRNEISLDHRIDIRLIVRMKTLELADHDIDDVEREQLDVLRGSIQGDDGVPDRHVREKRNPIRDDVDVEFSAPMQIASGAGYARKMLLDLAR